MTTAVFGREARALVWAFFGLCLSVYVLLSPGRIGGSDATEMLRLAEAIRSGTVAVDPVPGSVVQGPDGRWYSRYGLVYPLFLTPFMAVGDIAARVVGRYPAYYFTRFAASLVNPILVATTAALLLRLLLQIGFSRRGSLASAALFAFGSISFVHTKDGVSEPAAGLLLLLAYVLVREGTEAGRGVKTAMGSLALAGAVLSPASRCRRGPGIVFWLLLRRRRPVDLTQLAAFLVPGLVGVAVQLWYNAVRTGSPLKFGYGAAGALFGFPPVAELGFRLVSLWFSRDAGCWSGSRSFSCCRLDLPGCGSVRPGSPGGAGRLPAAFCGRLVLFGLVCGTEASGAGVAVLDGDRCRGVRGGREAPPRRPPPPGGEGREGPSSSHVLLFGVLFLLSLLAQTPHVLVPSIRMQTRLALDGEASDYWAVRSAPLIGGWRDVWAVSRVPKDQDLLYSDADWKERDPREWFERSATMNSFAFWFVHAGRLGVPKVMLLCLIGWSRGNRLVGPACRKARESGELLSEIIARLNSAVV